MMRKLAIAILLLLPGAYAPGAMATVHPPGPESSEQKHSVDHLTARAALDRGEVLSLETVLAMVRPKLKDEIVGIKFEMHRGIWYYEFRTVDKAGHLHYIHANAKTGIIQKVENHP
ncbi:PepSY domain-containing protein [Kordiimonas marina]|uniref:PepSY domain-containing protein n=1 Tax=Kordiimonas marina TaxID=2872312 RepID=UPI001FF4618E|nr:PepSY domain-containing protein [Kordiimonas marina]MCJ9428854.1 PepSY domain-containing protein [Kordiimonas marina]